MKLEERAAIYGDQLIAMNGADQQMGQLACELSELAVALFQHYQQGKSFENVLTELADVQNMLPQLVQLVEAKDKTEVLDAIREMKLMRVKSKYDLKS